MIKVLFLDFKYFVDAKFVDLGCGNGLLVHLLNLEGHSGYGIDIRKRAIWSLFPSSMLVERPVLPEESFSECNWILGNHTDELTPWVPIIAARSNAKFWLLPCCMFDLFGKWNNCGQSKSQYLNYLAFVRYSNLKIRKIKIRLFFVKIFVVVDLFSALRNRHFPGRYASLETERASGMRCGYPQQSAFASSGRKAPSPPAWNRSLKRKGKKRIKGLSRAIFQKSCGSKTARIWTSRSAMNSLQGSSRNSNPAQILKKKNRYRSRTSSIISARKKRRF